MKFTISRDEFLKPLQHVAGIVERRQTLAVLANVLLVVERNNLAMTGTDMEIEMVTNTVLKDEASEPGEITIPAKKLLDICKSLPTEAEIEISTEEGRAILKSGRSRFSLVTIPANEFPSLDEHSGATARFEVSASDLKNLVENTGFAMAQQDVRYYLNGMLFELQSDKQLRAVATDGHRLALSHIVISPTGEINNSSQAIIPRKSVLELARLFSEGDENIELILGNNYIQAKTSNTSLSSKLVDGKFPDYDRVIPKGGDKVLSIDREELRLALSRVAILSNDKFRGVRLILNKGNLQLIANNPEQEQAEENIAMDYEQADLEIGFNVSYLLDVMNTIRSETVEITLTDSNSSGVIRAKGDESSLYVVMPMRL